MADQIPYAVLHRVEEAFVAFLRTNPKLAGIDIVAASNRDALVNPLHIFVSCVEAVPQQSYGPLFKCRVQVCIVTNMDDTEHVERRRWAEETISHLTSADEYDYAVQVGDVSPTLSIMGWVVGGLLETSFEQQTIDVIPLTCGVISPIGAAVDGEATTV